MFFFCVVPQVCDFFVALAERTHMQGNGHHTLMFRVNGAPFFAKGANMIPMESLEGRYAETDLNLRCFAYSDALHPAARYAQGLIALRADDPRRLVFATIVGIPPHLASLPGAQILADRCRVLTDRMA